MDPTVISALIGGIATVITALVGKASTNRAKRDSDAKDARIDKLENKVEKLEAVIDLKDNAMNEIRAQRDKLQIAAELQDRFWTQIERKALDREQRP